MSTDELGRVIYLVLLGSVIAVYFFVQNRQRMGQVAQQAAIWGLIFLGAVALYGLWGDIGPALRPSSTVVTDSGEVQIRQASDGHYYVPLELNGTRLTLMVDTGATDMVLSEDDAAKIGINADQLAYTGIARTANGTVRTARVTLDDVQLGPFADQEVGAQVSEGEMPGSLLGMSYLSRFSTMTFSNGTLTLAR
ncbi:retropepsin-like aspartic protease family protein [Qingshengfaniella alkalisoli]|uniref:TIGR02281 family clan AA aspartic protease n=1 Tax=Qingshengfaniella alkalisoli TaxID=2599296 RepID=A0A5B8ISW9_9RHOB|nr:TIGR02281 family clan AA aspartic protease [Qingshengfaniella alkalisoli]QDY68714.1 TIGR02281 family clan AA aspartic protease [Qingshengfaniella alkalisoli]